MPLSSSRLVLIPFLSLASILVLTGLGSVLFRFSPLYAVNVTAFAGALFLLFRSPLALLLALIIVRMSLDFFGETVSLPITETLSITLSQLVGIGVAAIGLFLFTTESRARAAISRLWPLLVVMLWGFTSLTVSIAPDATVRELLRIFDIVALASLAFASVRTSRDYAWLLAAILLSSVVPIAAGIYQSAMGIGFSDDAVGIPRIYGTFSHPNVFSLYLFVIIVVTVLAATTVRKESPLAMAMFSVFGTVLAMTLLLTYTRVAWVILFVFLFVLAFVRFRAFLVPLVAIPLILYALVLPVQERVDSIFRADPGDSVSWRQDFWQAAIHRTLSEGRGATGFGMGTFYTVSGQLYDPALGGQNEAHNDFVKFFVEGGLLGTAVYLLFGAGILWPLFRRGVLRTRGTDPGRTPDSAIHLILFALALSLAAASLSDNIFKNTPVQWIFWALLAATWRVFGQKKKASSLR